MVTKLKIPRLVLFPPYTDVNEKDHIVIGGCDTVHLAAEYGTPLYIYDENGIRGRCGEFRREFGGRYARTTVVYAGKAFLDRAMAHLIKEEGLSLDVVSIGEASIARSVDYPMERVYFHGNNKSPEELVTALKWGIGHIVVDNFHELQLLDELCRENKCRNDILLRISPGIDPHTHKFLATGVTDSKFGFPMPMAEEAVVRTLSMPHLNLVGLHCHIGSSLFDPMPYHEAVGVMVDFAAKMKQRHNFDLKVLDIGGGFAVQYVVQTPAPPISAYAEVITGTVTEKCQEFKLPLPELIIEPGRSLTAQFGVALYTVGAIKDIPGVRRYVSVDGGMADNIRPALYGALQEALLANRAAARPDIKVTIAGRFCESGDILINDIEMPSIVSGDLLAVPGCGAYCIPQSSNYNAFLKPTILMVKDGKARMIRRRETFEDLIKNDMI